MQIDPIVDRLAAAGHPLAQSPAKRRRAERPLFAAAAPAARPAPEADRAAQCHRLRPRAVRQAPAVHAAAKSIARRRSTARARPRSTAGAGSSLQPRLSASARGPAATGRFGSGSGTSSTVGSTMVAEVELRKSWQDAPAAAADRAPPATGSSSRGKQHDELCPDCGCGRPFAPPRHRRRNRYRPAPDRRSPSRYPGRRRDGEISSPLFRWRSADRR